MQDVKSVWDEMKKIQQRMDSMFESLYNLDEVKQAMPKTAEAATSNYKMPVADLWEKDNEFVAEIELPGVNKKDIKVYIDENSIEVQADSKSSHEERQDGMYRFERNYKGFYRYFGLPGNIDPKGASTDYKDGILKVTIPRLRIGSNRKKMLEVK